MSAYYRFKEAVMYEDLCASVKAIVQGMVGDGVEVHVIKSNLPRSITVYLSFDAQTPAVEITILASEASESMIRMVVEKAQQRRARGSQPR